MVFLQKQFYFYLYVSYTFWLPEILSLIFSPFTFQLKWCVRCSNICVYSTLHFTSLYQVVHKSPPPCERWARKTDPTQRGGRSCKNWKINSPRNNFNQYLYYNIRMTFVPSFLLWPFHFISAVSFELDRSLTGIAKMAPNSLI